VIRTEPSRLVLVVTAPLLIGMSVFGVPTAGLTAVMNRRSRGEINRKNVDST
jgi:hypothetical protein